MIVLFFLLWFPVLQEDIGARHVMWMEGTVEVVAVLSMRRWRT